uniref:Uncharacterized protein n=1 Tax=Megaselia scalaris TaxID=36166 RepID=T1GK34_MEGSC
MTLSKTLFMAIFVVFAFEGVLCQQESSNESDVVESARTFGHHFLKRISFAIIPGAFVVGAVTTLLAALTVVSMNGLGVGLVFPVRIGKFDFQLQN